jgi:hypothetical protein
MVMADIYILAEEYDKAIDELDYLLSIESPFTVHILRHRPIFEPLRTLPRFQALIEKYEKEYGT